LHPVTQVDHVAAKRPLNADMMGVLKGSNAIIRTSPRSRRRRLNTGKFAKNIDVTLTADPAAVRYARAGTSPL